MKELLYIGIIMLAAGLSLIIFNNFISVSFCKIGKQIHKNNPLTSIESINNIYDIKKAPRIIRILGYINIFQGVFLITIWFIIKKVG